MKLACADDKRIDVTVLEGQQQSENHLLLFFFEVNPVFVLFGGTHK
jgi:hypothetical protein